MASVIANNNDVQSVEYTGPKDATRWAWFDTCPLCVENQKGVRRCRCMANDQSCAKGHHWHRHYFRKTDKDLKVYHKDGIASYACPYFNVKGTESCHCTPE